MDRHKTEIIRRRPFIARPFIAGASIARLVVMRVFTGLTAGKILLFAAILFILGSSLAVAIPFFMVGFPHNGSHASGSGGASGVDSDEQALYSGPPSDLGGFHFSPAIDFDGGLALLFEAGDNPPPIPIRSGGTPGITGFEVGGHMDFLNDGSPGSFIRGGSGGNDGQAYSGFSDGSGLGTGGGGGAGSGHGITGSTGTGDTSGPLSQGSPGPSSPTGPSSNPSTVPIPSGLWLLAPGLASLIAFRNRVTRKIVVMGSSFFLPAGPISLAISGNQKKGERV